METTYQDINLLGLLQYQWQLAYSSLASPNITGLTKQLATF